MAQDRLQADLRRGGGQSRAQGASAGVVTRTATADATYLEVFHLAGMTAFLAYGLAFVQDSIWFGKPWSITAKNMFDAAIYGSVTGGVFGWLAI